MSKVRSITLDSWEPELLKVMTELGNERVNQIYEAVVSDEYSRPVHNSLRSDFVTISALTAMFDRNCVHIEASIGPVTSSVCPRCASMEETAEHLLLPCPKWTAERPRYFGGCIDITDVFQDFENPVEFLISSGHLRPTTWSLPDGLVYDEQQQCPVCLFVDLALLDLTKMN